MSYQNMDYGARAAAYVDAFMQNIHWETASLRLSQAQQGSA